MFEVLRAHIEKRIQVSEEEFTLACRYFTPRKLKKRQFLLQEGDVCRHMAFVNSGCLRQYTVDHKGDEHILQFAIEDWWISDLNSYLTGTPSTHNIDVLEDADVLLLDTSARDSLMSAVPKMERLFRLLMEANYIATHRRIQQALSVSAEERYLAFLHTYPQMVELIPQHQIASYLGITPQSLSRIRKELSQKG